MRNLFDEVICSIQIKLTDCGIVISVIDLQCSNADEQIDVIDEGIVILVSFMQFLNNSELISIPG